jgi:hypothetical protein
MTAFSRPIASQDPSQLRSSPISLVPVVLSLSPHVDNRDLSHTNPTTLSCHRNVISMYMMIQVQRLDTRLEVDTVTPLGLILIVLCRYLAQSIVHCFLETLQAMSGLLSSFGPYPLHMSARAMVFQN